MSLSDLGIAAKWERWYSKQPYTNCKRCDRPFPSSSMSDNDYCSRDCELGYTVPPLLKEKGE